MSSYAKHVLGVVMSLAMMGGMMEEASRSMRSFGVEVRKRNAEDELQRIVDIRRAKQHKRGDR